ncbi:hypothetical protein GMD78_13015 [Ornithinibacillus sp. L9]|uniref:Uncharacterized protein n=1 Tax=Ornithinibacillus caprae TaxID=2678566 RepID=A0A6N8FIN6_9BACI|nr:hypothetical protein [Ornithinibacillus caprae]MUK89293.1 hypothetical protein [Ornithinibacillus caprae]
MIFRKGIVSVLSALILSLSLALLEYTPEAEQQTGVGYFSFGGLFFIYLIFSLPVYLIGGSLYSIVVDVFLGRIQFGNKLLKYVTELIIYVAGGLLIMGIIILMLTLPDGNNGGLYINRVFILGAVASLLFFHISLLWRKKWNSLRDKV